nr:G2/mitotic-specific cyclin S13-7-like isoform X1 [Ipomoea batatas]
MGCYTNTRNSYSCLWRGMIGGILFTFYQGSNLDSNAKMWRLIADFMKEKNSLRRKTAAKDSSRKIYTATLTARSKAACGLNIKLPKEKIEDIDAGDVYNELAVVEYPEDIYKFYKEAEDMMLCGGSDSVIIPTGFEFG